MKRTQLIWWGWRHHCFAFKRFDKCRTDLALIYKWTLFVGPFEIRRWVEEVER